VFIHIIPDARQQGRRTEHVDWLCRSLDGHSPSFESSQSGAQLLCRQGSRIRHGNCSAASEHKTPSRTLDITSLRVSASHAGGPTGVLCCARDWTPPKVHMLFILLNKTRNTDPISAPHTHTHKDLCIVWRFQAGGSRDHLAARNMV